MRDLILKILLFSIPSGREWVLALALLLCFLYWVKTIVEIAKSPILSVADKIVWIFIVIFTSLVGIIIYKLFVRKI